MLTYPEQYAPLLDHLERCGEQAYLDQRHLFMRQPEPHTRPIESPEEDNDATALDD
tara:strand:+ start:394 stop:561 length:168 start_codon:yes stop_codon:yes gene_type:complete